MIDHEQFVFDHPVDRLEPELLPSDQVRDARLATVHLLNDFAAKMHSALTRNMSAVDGLVCLWGIAYGMGLTICGEVSMSARADQLGIERATLSKLATAWNISHDLAPSFHQKSAGANETYAAVRRAVVQSSNGDLPPVPQRGRHV